jgi:spermidine/putrescine transport system substrate-binding protein
MSMHDARLTRRRMIERALAVAAVGFAADPLAAYASSSSSTGSEAALGSAGGSPIRMINYAGWIGKTEIADFKRATGNTIRQIVINEDQGRVAKLGADPHAADMCLGDLSDAARLGQLGVLAKLDWKKIPNYKKYVASFAKVESFSSGAALGIPTDFGRDGFAYRTDIVKEDLRTWKDLFDIAPKYSGKITLLNITEDTISSALLALGYSINTTSKSEIQKAGDLLNKVKPHLSALVSTNMMGPLLNGSGAIASDWDYDAGAVLAAHPDLPIKWVDPEDGARAYLDGWVAMKSSVLPNVEAFMNFHLDPKNYAKFVNTLGISPAMVPASIKYVKPSIVKSKILNPPKAVAKRIQFSLGHGASQQYRDQAWARFLSA